MVAQNKTHTRFWDAQEGADWIVKNDVHNDDQRAERDPMKLTKLERRRQQNQSYQNTFKNEYEQAKQEPQPEHDKVDIVPEHPGADHSMYSPDKDNRFDESE